MLYRERKREITDTLNALLSGCVSRTGSIAVKSNEVISGTLVEEETDSDEFMEHMKSGHLINEDEQTLISNGNLGAEEYPKRYESHDVILHLEDSMSEKNRSMNDTGNLLR
jgi:hypothetical protein